MQRFLPGKHLIDSFGNGGFRLAGVSHQGAILIVPSGVRALPVISVADLTPHAFDLVMAEKAEIDMFFIGTGADMSPLPRQVSQHLRDQGIGFEIMTTNAAVRTYNVVLEEDRRVAALLFAVP
jgi:uncharacterized protein